MVKSTNVHPATLSGKASKPSVTESVRKGGGRYPPFPLTFSRSVFGNRPSVKGGGVFPLSVNFFPLTFWVKNTKKNAACGEKFLDFASVKGGGVPPLSVKFFLLTLQKNLVR